MRARLPSQLKLALLSGLAFPFALVGCAAGEIESGRLADQGAAPAQLPAAGGVARRGDSFALMSEQYAPRAGASVATGASAWVESAPPPAFVATGPLPPADAPAPPPAAVANRQPSRPAPPASDIVRPEAAVPDAAPAAGAPVADDAVRSQGLALFNDYSCGACHGLADAGASGSVGPSLDRNPRLTRDYVLDLVTNGRGAMPAFGGQLTAEQVATLADYIVQFSRK